MEIIAHRGIRHTPEQKNTLPALLDALNNGFGVETDIRDRGGELLIAHDPPTADSTAPLLRDLLGNYADMQCRHPLALNIKADGLCEPILQLLRDYTIPRSQVFFFDMSVPDMRHYHRAGAPFYTRVSDIEPQPVMLPEAAGLWVDAFSREWLQAEHLEQWAANGKRIALVSPELHGRQHQPVWQQWRELLKNAKQQPPCMLCTDHPQTAKDFFNA